MDNVQQVEDNHEVGVGNNVNGLGNTPDDMSVSDAGVDIHADNRIEIPGEISSDEEAEIEVHGAEDDWLFEDPGYWGTGRSSMLQQPSDERVQAVTGLSRWIRTKGRESGYEKLAYNQIPLNIQKRANDTNYLNRIPLNNHQPYNICYQDADDNPKVISISTAAPANNTDTRVLLELDDVTAHVTNGYDPALPRHVRLAAYHMNNFLEVIPADLDDIEEARYRTNRVNNLPEGSARHVNKAIPRYRKVSAESPESFCTDNLDKTFGVAETLLQFSGHHWLESVINFFVKETASIYVTTATVAPASKDCLKIMLATLLHAIKLDRLMLTAIHQVTVFLNGVLAVIHLVIMLMNTFANLLDRDTVKTLLPNEYAIPSLFAICGDDWGYAKRYLR